MSKSPGEQLKLYIYSHVDENNLPQSLKDEIPRKWEKYNDFVLFDSRSFSNELWFDQEPNFWLGICDILKCRRIALKNKIQNNGFRSPNVRIVIGDDPWITYVDNSIKYSWNVMKNMFSAGNASERHRLAKLNCRNEVVVDLFAGIGYFVLPFLVHAKAEYVHACEWNPDAALALRRNLKLNNVEDKCTVYEGDNNAVCPKSIADRVNLGLIPSSEGSWRVACEALKPSGGILHIHGNVETFDESVRCEKCTKLVSNVESDSKLNLNSNGDMMCEKWHLRWKRHQWSVWAIHVLHSLISILLDLNPDKMWKSSVENIHNVKSYAPHVDHLVLDVLLSST